MATPAPATKRLGDVIVLSTFFVSALSVGFLGGVFFDNPHAPTVFIHPAVDSFESLNLPRASLGILGSCYQPNAGETNACNHLDGNRYIIDDLPSTTAKGLLLPPPASIAGFIYLCFSLAVFSAVYWVIYTLYRMTTGNRLKIITDPAKASATRHIVNFTVKWVPFTALIFGLNAFLCWYMLSLKMVHDFNGYNDVRPGGRQEDDLVAKLASGFVYAWICFAALFHVMTVLWVDSYYDEPPQPKP